jgi:Cu/Ag efflux pump CusA
MKEYRYIMISFMTSLLVCILLYSAFLLTDKNTLLTLSAIPIVLTGSIISWINSIVLIGYAFEKSAFTGLVCLFFPIVIFVCLDAEQWKTATTPLFKTLIGFGISMLGVGFIIITHNFG